MVMQDVESVGRRSGLTGGTDVQPSPTDPSVHNGRLAAVAGHAVAVEHVMPRAAPRPWWYGRNICTELFGKTPNSYVNVQSAVYGHES